MLVRKIKKYNKERIKVVIDGKARRMTFKSTMQAVKLSKKSYFKEDGSVHLQSYAGRDEPVSEG
jgi:hypothetical protein